MAAILVHEDHPKSLSSYAEVESFIILQRLLHLTDTVGCFTGNPFESLLVASRPDCWRSLPKIYLLLEMIKINLYYFASSQQS
jgi:hypothetical protein